MLLMTETMPLTKLDMIGRGDTIFFSDGHMFQVRKIAGETYGGDYSPINEPGRHDWVWLTLDELIQSGARIEFPTVACLPC